MQKQIMMTFLFLVLAAAMISCAKQKSQITIKGSSSELPIVMMISEHYSKNNDVYFSITGAGSSNGIRSLLDGGCDIANSSRAMTPGEMEDAIERGIDIQETVTAYDMVVPVVHPSNPVNNLSIHQLQAIYRGDIRDWSHVGGKKGRISVVSRDSGSGTYHIWHKKVIVHEEITRDALLQGTNGTMVVAVAENPRSIGYISYGYINKSLKPLSVDGVYPTIQNGKNGTYPISRKLYMYTDKKRLKNETAQFIDFVVSEKGQELIREAGYIPL